MHSPSFRNSRELSKLSSLKTSLSTKRISSSSSTVTKCMTSSWRFSMIGRGSTINWRRRTRTARGMAWARNSSQRILVLSQWSEAINPNRAICSHLDQILKLVLIRLVSIWVCLSNSNRLSQWRGQGYISRIPLNSSNMWAKINPNSKTREIKLWKMVLEPGLIQKTITLFFLVGFLQIDRTLKHLSKGKAHRNTGTALGLVGHRLLVHPLRREEAPVPRELDPSRVQSWITRHQAARFKRKRQ